MDMEKSQGLNIPWGIQEGLSQLIPTPSTQYHKGQMGRICVIGGSLQYVGAAYYAAMSSLRSGADLLYMVCCERAVPSLKAYSPEIMVIPHYLDNNGSVDPIMTWMSRMHAILIGPGLGTDPLVQQNVISIIEKLKLSNINIPLILDADGLRILAQCPSMLLQYNGPVYLTPNKREQQILLTALGGEEEARRQEMDQLDCERLGHNVILVLKGSRDQILSSNESLTCSANTSWRRCGGQGDLLAGTLATLAHYAQLKRNEKVDDRWEMFAGFAACTVVRKANSIAFEKKGRSMLVTDMLGHFHEALSAVFPSWKSWHGPEDDPNDN